MKKRKSVLPFKTYCEVHDEFEDAIHAFFDDVLDVHKRCINQYLTPEQQQTDLSHLNRLQRLYFCSMIAEILLENPGISSVLRQDLEEFKKNFENSTMAIARLYKLFGRFVMSVFPKIMNIFYEK